LKADHVFSWACY